jgi:Phage tail tube protein, GTA-gp10
MANPYRGEAALELDERRFTLRLTLGALAELETAFGAEGLAALGEKLGAGKLAARDVLNLLGPLIRGGGERLGEHEISSMITARDLPQVVEAIADCFAAAMPGEESARPHP